MYYNEKCSQRFGRNHGPSSGEVKEKPHKSTDINKTLIKKILADFGAHFVKNSSTPPTDLFIFANRALPQ